MRHSLSKDTAFNGATRNVCPLAIPESCAQNMGIRLLENHSLKRLVILSVRHVHFAALCLKSKISIFKSSFISC